MFDATDQPNSVKCIVHMWTACGLDFRLFKDSFQDQKKENWILENVVKHKLLEKRTGQKGQEKVLSKAENMHTLQLTCFCIHLRMDFLNLWGTDTNLITV